MVLSNGRLFAQEPRQDVEGLIEDFMATADRGPQQKLYAMPTEELLAQLAPLMREDPRFTEAGSTWKMVGYRALVRHEAEKHKLGRELLIEGLSDSSDSISRMCLERIINHLPPGDYPDLRAAVRKLWDAARIENLSMVSAYPEDEYAPLRTVILNAGLELGVVGRDAGLQLLLGIVDNQNLPPSFRIAAAGRVMAQLGLRSGLDYFKDADAEVVEGIVRDLVSQAGKNGAFRGDELKQSAARAFVLELMTHENANARKLALQALVWVFGWDWVTIRSAEDYEINPTVESAVRRMATNDPDAELRKQAAEFLADAESKLDRAAENILRERQAQNDE